MSFNWNNVKPACCARWLVLPTAYSDALSYGEQLDKFCYQLNQLIENNNILPDFIAEMIKEYINSGAIGEVVRDILADYILNVKYPPNGITPAIGNGSADDTIAIQGCIDYAAENGGVVYFPYGSYLTQPLNMKDGVSLFGFDRYSTKIVLKGGATKPLIGGTIADLSIANLTLDGNSGIQVNDVNVVTIVATNVLFTNLIIKDGYTLVNYVGTGGHFQISDVVFGNAVEKCLLTTGNADVQCENVVFNQLSAVGGISVMDIGTDGGFFNVKSLATCNQCIVVSGNNNKISAIVENAAIPVVDNGLHNNIEIFGISNKEFYSGDTSKEVNGNYYKRVGGTYTKTVDGNSKESVNGTKNTVVTGVTTETYEDDRTVTNNNFTENTTGKKVCNLGSETKTISGKSETIVTGDCVERVNNKIIDTLNDYRVNSDNFTVNSKKPLTYKTPTVLNGYYKSIPFKDYDGNIYYVLVRGDVENFEKITGVNDFKTVFDYGAAGDGVTDDFNAFQSAYESGNTILIPPATYYCSKVVETKQGVDTNFIIGSEVTFNNVKPLEINTENTKLLMHATADSSAYNNYEIGIYNGEGGRRGYVLSTHTINSIINSNTKNFVWGLLSILTVADNITSDSENVGVYSQVNGKESSDTGLWGGCIEVNDYKVDPKASKIGLEITYRSNLSDTNHARHALHISLEVKDGASGGNISSGVLISGNNDNAYGPVAGVDTGIRFEGCQFQTLIGGGRTGKQKTKANYGIDFGNFDIKNLAIRLADKSLGFLKFKIHEYDNKLNISNGTNTLGITTTPVTKASLSDNNRALPITIDGQQFYLKLYE